MRAEAIELLSTQMIVETPIPGGMLKFFAPSTLLQDRAATLLTKEPDMISWINGIGKDAVLWDIGANVGVFSLYAAARLNCKVLSFEPSGANFFVLARNIQLNRLNEQVTAYCVALSGATELGVLNVGSAAMGAAMSQFGKTGEMSRYLTDDSESAVHGMVGFTVDDFIARFNPLFPTHIKMDVDGLEWPILQGATRTLSDLRLRAAIVELSLTNHEERARAMALLEDSGLTYVSRGFSQGTATEKAANHLFIRPSG
jgi:FkbM family methyltransferase